MKQAVMVSLLLFSSFGFAQGTKFVKKKFSIGESVIFHSIVLNEERALNIYLPFEYSPDSSKTYPVIYLLDGSVDEDFIHIAGLVQFLSFPWINEMPECIVVGISNVDRRRDFTWPTRNEQDKMDYPTTGGSQNFIDFLRKEVIPLINENYKSNGNRTIVGQSLGGLLATEILYEFPELFNRYVIVSPSTWWDNGSILDLEPNGSIENKSIFIAVGKEEKQMIAGAKRLYAKWKKLKSKNNVYFQYYPGYDHGDVLHHAAYDGFIKIFGPQN
jgi:predicted alpha/beta superfamily hydrolase